MPNLILPGNNPALASGYVVSDLSHDGYLLEKLVEAIQLRLVEEEKPENELLPWDEHPYRYALIYDTEAVRKNKDDVTGRRSWKLFEIKEPTALDVTTVVPSDVTTLLCKKVRGDGPHGVVRMTAPRADLLRDLARALHIAPTEGQT